MNDQCCGHLHRCGDDRRHFHACCAHWHGQPGMGKTPWKALARSGVEHMITTNPAGYARLRHLILGTPETHPVPEGETSGT